MSRAPQRMAHLLATLVGAAAMAAALSRIASPTEVGLELSALGRDWTIGAPERLWGLMLCPLVWLAPAFGLSDLPRWQQAASAAVRTALVAMVTLALAQTGTVRREERVAVVVLADVSDSVSDGMLAKAEEYVHAIRQGHPGQPLKLVAFAERPVAIPLPPAGRRGFLERPEAGGATDLEAALKMAYGLFPPERHKRIIVISDGHETDGDALAEVGAARDAGVRIDFVAPEVPRPPEVLVQDVHVPERIEAEAAFTLTANLFSTTETTARITLWQDEYKQAAPQEVSLEPGPNAIEFPATVHDPGFRRFKVDIEPPADADRTPANNSAQATAVVAGDPRILIVEGDPRAAGYLARALRKERFEVEVRGPHGVPSSLDELEDFDLFVLSDVSATHVSAAQMALISRYVRQLGGGFLMAGGEDSFGLGGYYKTPLEELLPVRFEAEKKREAPSLAIALLIDKSGSMTGEKIQLAKDAALATVELLSKDDQIAVFAFDSSLQPLVRLQSARNRVRIRSQIQRLAAGGGTNIQPALAEAYRQLRPAEARLKHVILLSDGQSSPTGLAELAADMAADAITITSVAVGAEADRNLLNTLADLGGGRAYFTDDPFNIPKIFTKETQTVARNALVEQPLRVRSAKDAQLLRGVGIERAPYLLGYVSTKPKRGAEILLETESGEPLLARWRRGLGTAAVWTSDVKNRWAVEWVRWRGWTRLWSQMARDMMRRTDTDGLELRAEVIPGGGGRIVLDAVDQADRWRNGLAPVAEVTDPGGGEREVTLRQVAAGRYAAKIALPKHGAYLIRARPDAKAKRTASLKAGLSYPYPPEYLSVGVRRPLLERLATATGGRADPPAGSAYDAGGRTIRFTTELKSPIFLAALLLFILDVLLRRVRMGRAGEVAFR